QAALPEIGLELDAAAKLELQALGDRQRDRALGTDVARGGDEDAQPQQRSILRWGGGWWLNFPARWRYYKAFRYQRFRLFVGPKWGGGRRQRGGFGWPKRLARCSASSSRWVRSAKTSKPNGLRLQSTVHGEANAPPAVLFNGAGRAVMGEALAGRRGE